MPNWFPEGTGEEGDEHGEQYRQYQAREKDRRWREEQEERQAEMPARCESVYGCRNKPFGKTEGAWLCLECFALNDKFG